MRERRVGGGPSLPPALLLAVLGPALALILAATAQRAVEGYQMARQVDAARKEVADLTQQNLALQDKIARYRSDNYVEKIAREELNLVRPGDVPVIVVAPTAVPQSATPPRPSPTVPVHQQWLRHFFDEPQ